MGRKHIAFGFILVLFLFAWTPGTAGAEQRTYEVTSEAQFFEAVNEINALDEDIYEVVIKSDITVKQEVALEKSTVSLLGENTRLTFGAGGALLVRGEAELRLGTASSSGSLTIDSTDTRPIIATLDSARLDRLVGHLEDTASFNRPGRIPSLAANHPKYKANGRYWQGGVWPGTNYMVMRGLVEKGYRELAREICLNHYAEVLEVYKNTGTFWEYYAPESAKPGFMARKEFVGWAGLPPIAELIEFIIGIRGDYVERQIVWDLNLTEENGIERYPFGPDGMIDLKAEARRSPDAEPRITVSTNIPFTLVVLYGDKEKKIAVEPGRNTY